MHVASQIQTSLGKERGQPPTASWTPSGIQHRKNGDEHEHRRGHDSIAKIGKIGSNRRLGPILNKPPTAYLSQGKNLFCFLTKPRNFVIHFCLDTGFLFRGFVLKIATGVEGNEIQSGAPNSKYTCNRRSLEIGRNGVSWWSQSRIVTGSISQYGLRIRANDEPGCWQDDLAGCQGRHGIVLQEFIFFHRGDGLQESSFVRFICDCNKKKQKLLASSSGLSIRGMGRHPRPMSLVVGQLLITFSMPFGLS